MKVLTTLRPISQPIAEVPGTVTAWDLTASPVLHPSSALATGASTITLSNPIAGSTSTMTFLTNAYVVLFILTGVAFVQTGTSVLSSGTIGLNTTPGRYYKASLFWVGTTVCFVTLQ